MWIVSAAIAVSLLAGAQAPSAEADVPDREYPGWLEIGPTAISARVRTNGCTKKEDFKVSVHRSDGSTRLVFWRQKPDPCRAYIRDGIVLRWTRAELGLGADESLAVSWGSGF